jgi:predicted nucleotidyltransferase
MSERIRRLVSELKSSLQEIYGNRLRGVYLFGSHARGEADTESDVDVLIILDRVGRYADEIERTSETIGSLALRYGVSISRVFASEAQWREDQTLFFLNIREDAILA